MALDITNLPNSIFTNMKSLLTDADVGGTTYDVTITGVYPNSLKTLDNPIIVINSNIDSSKDNIGDGRLRNKPFMVTLDIVAKTAVEIDAIAGDLLYALESTALEDARLINLTKGDLDYIEIGNTKAKIMNIAASYLFRG